MPASRRDVVRLSALAASALALPALADTKPLKPMRLLILGGTGFIGPYQVRYALARGHHVTIFNRGRQQEAWPGPVEELLGDRNGDLKALEGRDWDVCIDNPTSLPVWVRDAARVLKGHVGRYIFISTISVYAANDKPADEAAPLVAYKGDDPMAETIKTLNANPKLYGPLKALSEKEAQTQYGEAATTIIRPSLIVGPGDETDRFTYWPVRLARGGEILAPGDGSDPVQFIDARDLAEWTIRMAERQTIGAFNAGGPAGRDHPAADAGGDCSGNRCRYQDRLGALALSEGEQGRGLARHARVDSRPGRNLRLPPSRHPPRHRRGPHLPPPTADRSRYARLVP
ncbi:MAG TPA: NAD-dependent epimerase/dehydratase family protein, partial [Reyranella sp.]|nr:NAD-dependent epimerase/dehydratase family protein [Reyranella sp.]